MSYDTERAEIEAYFKAQCEAEFPNIVLGFDAQKFTPPVDGESIEVEIASGGAEQISFGDPANNLERNAGLIIARIRVPGGQGSNRIREIADKFKGIFINAEIGSVKCRIPYVQTRIADAPFLGWSMAVPFTRDTFTA